MKNYQIYPILVGEMISGDKSSFGYRLDPGVKISAPFISFLIKGEDTLILVDTGCSDEEWSAKYHYPIKRTEEMKIENGLKKFGISPEDINIVVFTHLHWDHCYNHQLFKNARFYVQKKEIEFGLSPLPSQYISYESFNLGMTPVWVDAMKQFETIDGDFRLQEGIDLVLLQGHTPGSQGVLVNTKKGKYLITGDAVQLYECWEKRSNGFPIPCGILVDLYSYHETFKKMMCICNHIIPAHDWRVFEHEVYPD